MSLPTISQLLLELEAQHEPARHLYRGQVRRYEPHRWQDGKGQHELEALYPSDFRFHYKHQDIRPGSAHAVLDRIIAARAYNREVRDQFVVFLAGQVARLDDWSDWGELSRKISAAKGDGERTLPQERGFYRAAWSIAQHYLIDTALTDVTFDLRVAAWFATNPWDAKSPIPVAGTRGVIYRIDREKLESVFAFSSLMAEAQALIHEDTPPPEMFIVDIREIPASFARRPSAQRGASVYGFDQPFVVRLALSRGAVQIFEFEHRAGIDVGVTREDVVPSTDPFLQRLDQFEEIRTLLRQGPSSGPEASAKGSLLDRASTAMKLWVRSARQVRTHRLTDGLVATVFDQIERPTTTRFSYLMVVEHESTKALVCAISAEPLLPSPALHSESEAKVVRSLGLSMLRLWRVDGSVPLDMADSASVDEFEARALQVVQAAFSSCAQPPPAS